MEWIKINDDRSNLPMTGASLLLTIALEHGDKYVSKGFLKNKKFYSEHGKFRDECVTHYMYYPEPAL